MNNTKNTESNSPSTDTIKDNIDRALNGDLATSTILEDTNNQNVNKPIKNNSTNDLRNTNEFKSTDNLREGLRKQNFSPCSRGEHLDKVILSENYFTHFMLISSIVIFFIGLFN